MRRLHPIVKYLLEQRYQQNILNEDEDSPVAKVASGSYAKLFKNSNQTLGAPVGM